MPSKPSRANAGAGSPISRGGRSLEKAEGARVGEGVGVGTGGGVAVWAGTGVAMEVGVIGCWLQARDRARESARTRGRMGVMVWGV